MSKVPPFTVSAPVGASEEPLIISSVPALTVVPPV